MVFTMLFYKTGVHVTDVLGLSIRENKYCSRNVSHPEASCDISANVCDRITLQDVGPDMFNFPIQIFSVSQLHLLLQRTP
jgi:hypothetical protein